MALQLTGAFKRDIAGESAGPAAGDRRSAAGSPAIDTATELLAYYPVQCEKNLERYETLARRVRRSARSASAAIYDAEERAILGGVPRARPGDSRRARARRRATVSRRTSLRSSRAWGGVTIAVPQAAAGLARVPAQPRGGRQGARGGHPLRREPRRREAPPTSTARWPRCAFERQERDEDGEFRSSARSSRCPRASLCVAAGTRRNVLRARAPGTFEIDRSGRVLHDRIELTRNGERRIELGPRREGASSRRYQKDGQTGRASTATTTRVTPATSSRRWRPPRTGYAQRRRGVRRPQPASLDLPRGATERGRRLARALATLDDELRQRATWTGQPPDADDRRSRRARPAAARKFRAGPVLSACRTSRVEAPIVDGRGSRWKASRSPAPGSIRRTACCR